jgi:hypothetical protein
MSNDKQDSCELYGAVASKDDPAKLQALANDINEAIAPEEREKKLAVTASAKDLHRKNKEHPESNISSASIEFLAGFSRGNEPRPLLQRYRRQYLLEVVPEPLRKDAAIIETARGLSEGFSACHRSQFSALNLV